MPLATLDAFALGAEATLVRSESWGMKSMWGQVNPPDSNVESRRAYPFAYGVVPSCPDSRPRRSPRAVRSRSPIKEAPAARAQALGQGAESDPLLSLQLYCLHTGQSRGGPARASAVRPGPRE